MPIQDSPENHLRAILDQIAAFQNPIRQCVVSSGNGDEFAYAESAVIELLSKGPMSVPQLARARRTSRQNIQIVVNRLIRGGFLDMQANPAHKRSPLLRLANRAADIPEKAEVAREELLARLLPGFTEQELEQTTSFLSRLGQLLSPMGSAQSLAPAKEPTRFSYAPNRESDGDRAKSKARAARSQSASPREEDAKAAKPQYVEPEEIPVSLL